MDYPTEKQVGLLCHRLKEWGSSIPSKVRKGCDYKWSDLSDALAIISRREIATLIDMAGAASNNNVHPATLLSRIEEIQKEYWEQKKCGICKQSHSKCCC